MECKRFDELIYLHIDGRLDERGERLLREHCEACERCARKLALQRTAEEQAGKIELEPPPPEYWRTFSSRVIERIDTGGATAPESGLKRILGSILSFPFARPRLAAAVASVAVVIVVAALFVNRRGGEIAPRRRAVERIQDVRQVAPGDVEEREYPRVEEGGTGTIEETEKLTVEEAGEGTIEESDARAAPAEAVPVTEKAKKGSPPPAEEDALAGKESVRREGPAEEEREEAVERLDTDKATFRKMPEKMLSYDKKRTAVTASEAAKTGAADEAIEFLVVNGSLVPRILESDTYLTESQLEDLIGTWTKYISENPDDTLSLLGYEQTATAYLLLARKTPDEARIREGERRIEDFAGRADDPELRATLLDILRKIRTVRKK